MVGAAKRQHHGGARLSRDVGRRIDIHQQVARRRRTMLTADIDPASAKADVGRQPDLKSLGELTHRRQPATFSISHHVQRSGIEPLIGSDRSVETALLRFPAIGFASS